MPGRCSLFDFLLHISPLSLFQLVLLVPQTFGDDIPDTTDTTSTAAAIPTQIAEQMAIYDIGETIVYRSADGSEAVGVIKSISDPLTDTASALYEIEDVDTGDKSSIYETRILGSMDFDT